MTRIPEPGRVKTRLIPTLGQDGAAALHTALLVRTLREADRHAQQSGIKVEVRYTGKISDSIQDYPKDGVQTWREQQGTDLGERIHSAISTAHSEGAEASVVIGTDCPDISAELLSEAWLQFALSDVVIGPADDGGYYLIGMQHPDARLFQGIDWGTQHVLDQTLARCREFGKSYSFLPALSDVDHAEDLIDCRRYPVEFTNCLPSTQPGLLSVVIPTLNEVTQLETTVAPILSQPNCEVVIADGGSTDGTLELARHLGCRVVSSNRGRARQMNSGAALARGEILLFLHADTKLPIHFCDEVRDTLNAGAIAGAFRFQIDYPGWSFRCVEWGARFRSKYLQRPYGDQGLFLRADDFFRLGGYKNWPLMEDLELSNRLKRHGKIGITPSAALTSPRRWLKLGVWRTTIINQLCLTGYQLGVSPQRLAGWYSSYVASTTRQTPSPPSSS